MEEWLFTDEGQELKLREALRLIHKSHILVPVMFVPFYHAVFLHCVHLLQHILPERTLAIKPQQKPRFIHKWLVLSFNVWRLKG